MNDAQRIAQGTIRQLHQSFLQTNLSAVSQAHDVIIQYLTAQQQRGKHHIYLTDEARATLRELQEESRAPQPAHPSNLARLPTEAPPQVAITGGSKAAQLQSLRHQIATWRNGQALENMRTELVFSEGSPDAELVIIGESPGYEDEKRRCPFAGATGEKLDRILTAMGLSREKVYLTNIAKFRPKTRNQTTNNRALTAAEVALFMPWLRAELAILQPKVILAAGETVAQFLLENQQPTATLRGKWHAMDGTPLRASLHPSCLLIAGDDLKTKRALWEDMLAVMEHLSMAITEKHRGYFLPKT